MSQPTGPILEVSRWHEFHKRARSPFFSGLFLGGTGLRKSGFPFDNRVRYFGTFRDHVAVSLDEKLKLREKALRHLEKEPGYLLQLMERGYQEHEKAVRGWKRANQADFEAISSEGLANHFQNYVDDLYSFGIYVTLPLFVEDYLEETIRSGFAERFGDDADAWFGVAVDPVKGGAVLFEELARLRLITQKQTGDLHLLTHAEKFGWMANTGFREEYYGVDHYRKLVLAEKDAQARLDSLTKSREKHQESFAELLERIKDDAVFSSIVRTANEAVFFRSFRTEMFYGSSSYNQPLLKAAAARLGLASVKNLMWLYADEIVRALTSGAKADSELIERRRSGYVFLSDIDGVYWSWEGDGSAAAYNAYQHSEEGEINMTELQGTGAFPGKITGRVMVIHRASEAKELRDGDVLVTHATNVDFVPILKKVSAVVTEEGGILSHAAIISRELRIPCVIGTKIATQVFKDGDTVEVDAHSGVVRLIG